ncbi:hypothetical protein BGX28_000392 [Mortierella sp. GBA30]|nr:hypothetical protein BGX28_000392 [Mortierella sp. GBA30]
MSNLFQQMYKPSSKPSSICSYRVLTIFCIIDGQPSLNAFCIRISDRFTVYDLQSNIKLKMPKQNVEQGNLRLWGVLVENTNPGVVRLSDMDDTQKRQLFPTVKLSTVYLNRPIDGHIHIVIENVNTTTATPPPPPSSKFTKRAACTLEEPSQDSDSCVMPGPSTKRPRFSFAERLESDLDEIWARSDNLDEEAEPSANPEELSKKCFDTHCKGMELLDRLTTKKLYWSDRIFDLIAGGISQSERSRVEKYMNYLRQAEKDTDQIIQWLRYIKHLAGGVGHPGKVYKGRQSGDEHTSFLENPF